MKQVYHHQPTDAYFSLQSVQVMQNETDFNKPHPWFSLLIINAMNGRLMVDDYRLDDGSGKALFVTPGQHLFISKDTDCEGYIVSFNKEFYCIEFHDSEVSCNGLLFANNFELVLIDLQEQQKTIYNNTVKEILGEFSRKDNLQGEMLKNLLRNLLIRSNRLFREQNSTGEVDDTNFDFSRKFSDLVEKHFRETKRVEDYAEMMGIAAASLTKKLQKSGVESPSRTIINRTITEAKRLLRYSDKSIKEIADIIGYDDQYYFSRLFSKETGISPSDYKKNHPSW